jgi:division protein CdvB (Snf7/Vps24/ESCRT-III family)
MTVNRYNIIGRLVEDEMNIVRSMDLLEMDEYVKGLISEILDKKTNEELVELEGLVFGEVNG